MKKRRLATAIITIVLITAGIGMVVLYMLGDRVFDEVIDNQITELEKVMEQPAPVAQTPAVAAAPDTKVAIEVTKEKLEAIKESVTPTDKMAAAKIVLTKLNKSDINNLTKLTANGITAEEKTEMKSIVYSKLTSQEIEEIKAMFYKYMK